MAANLILKWGAVKGWDGFGDEHLATLQRYFADGEPASAAADKPNAERRAILCELIDQIDGEIWNDWDGVAMTKEDAKRYVNEYRIAT